MTASENLWFTDEELAMQEAIQLAQNNFSSFKEDLIKDRQRIIPAIEESLIKYAFETENKDVPVEHMFLSDIFYDGSNIIGIIYSEPIYTESVQAGNSIIVDINQVTDWLYIIDGKTYGGYTFKYMWKCFTDEEKAMYKDQPPFIWLEL